MQNIQFSYTGATATYDFLVTREGSVGIELINHGTAQVFLSRNKVRNATPANNACLVCTGPDGQDFLRGLRGFIALIDREAPEKGVGKALAYPHIVRHRFQIDTGNVEE